MDHTYQNNDCEESRLNYEEKIIPKEIDTKSDKNCRNSRKLFDKFQTDDLLLLLILLILLNDDGDDNFFIIIMIALIFLR